MTDQTGKDRYAGTTPQSTQQQSQSQSQAQSQGGAQGGSQADLSERQPQGDTGQGQPAAQAGSTNASETAQAGDSQYEVNTPDRMPHDENQARRRQQAGAQSDHEPDRKGFGYGAQDGEEMADAPDASERGYGGASEEREEKLDDRE